ncbi:Ppx/GppA phosphatase family protein [Hydrogenimonas cancrithermarum]|uniref:Guanosine polyphosphate pyrophosphohydrolase n=1 Tax=Hydrogenimonas cancrithermarum TaxID=2993563 RepID=A0ABM8FJT6_9BACT|nr:Ppx/GppA phosphatase family protein [Hydrogenimonas cancrithermarum]BDY12561.1 guanosine polyphosphate pyrophosphohydrolase [Hydrogenimonas cancrithermarum]
MAKRTAIIDIGSNSARMVVFERTSRYGFYLLNETRSRVRISEGAYEKGGELQPEAMERAFSALAQFLDIAKSYKTRKILCVATSAVRDASNKKLFLQRVERELGLRIKIVDGEKEAWLGGIAAVNLLPVKDAITIDIGGGSTDMALIRNRCVIETFSLDIGTVRLKELFFDKKRPIEEAKEFIDTALASLPKCFHSDLAVGIGGTIRAMAKAIMQRNDHSIDKIHAFTFSVEEESKFIRKVAHASVMKLSKYGIKKDRLDTIRPGALIFLSVLEKIGAKEVMTSGVGVREGLFLSDLLRNSNHLFPANFNPSVRSLQDRFCVDTKLATHIAATARKLFFALKDPFDLPDTALRYLEIAAKLSQIGIRLDFYAYHKHSAYMIMNDLDFGFTHEEMILVATLIRFNKRRLPKESFTKPHKRLLPDGNTLSWLSYIVSLAQTIHISRAREQIDADYRNGVLTINAPFDTYLAKERVKELEKPAPIAVEFV